ncbi:MAG: Crp/Fnr family transcriptional regulator [Acidobacteriota bacterium]
MTDLYARPKNHLLSSLPAAENARLGPMLERFELSQRMSLNQPGEEASHVYFPLTGVVSLVTRLSDGSGVEAATIGNEGMVGLPALLENRLAPIEAVVQIPGESLRIPSAKFSAELPKLPALSGLLLDYTRVLFLFVAQSTACNRRHELTERCARWLLTSHDRTFRSEFALTHESLGEMLGVRRASVTVAAGKLRDLGLIDYSQGSIRIIDRAGLELRSCECYRVVRELFDLLALKGFNGRKTSRSAS